MNKEIFKQVYLESLKEAIVKYPSNYCWPIENAPIVANKMFAAMDANTFNHDSHAYRIAAKKLEIKPTRKAILEFWNS